MRRFGRGAAITLARLDPVKASNGSGMINGIAAVPVIYLGWIASLTEAVCVLGMLFSPLIRINAGSPCLLSALGSSTRLVDFHTLV
jgi:hypothetical protein